MNIKVKSITVLILLGMTMYLSFAFPKTKYEGTNFISELNIPKSFSEWQGRDVTKKLNINTADTNFNFINEAIANQYINNKGESLLFIILDAGNFHHPKVCFTGAGYKLKELPDTVFNLLNHTFKAHTLFTVKGNESFLSFYWIVIDKNIAHKWIEQKLKQLYFSMLNKDRVGLMIRLDIPVKEENIEDAMDIARQFTSDLNQHLSSEQSNYIWGER